MMLLGKRWKENWLEVVHQEIGENLRKAENDPRHKGTV